MDYNKVLFSRSTFHEKAQKNLFFRCRSKTLILAKIYIFTHAHLKCKTCFEGLTLNIVLDVFRNLKIDYKSHVTFCDNMAQRKHCVLFCLR